MQFALAVVLILAGGFGLWYWGFRDPGPGGDLGRLQGDWKVTLGTRDPSAKDEDQPSVVIRVKGDRWTYIAQGHEGRSYRVTLNPGAGPKEIDLAQLGPDGQPLTFTHGPGKGTEVRQHGVYFFEGDSVRVVLRPGVEPRPTTPDAAEAQILILKRGK